MRKAPIDIEPEPAPPEESGAFLCPDIAPDLPYTVEHWAHLPRYQCKFCPFDSLDEDVAREHFLSVHKPPEWMHVAGIILDRYGNPIVRN